jgi:glycosyltransferase involved in cell wall biosynthesis
MSRIKVFYVINNLHIGGAEQLLVNLASYLERERFEMVVCALWSDGPIGQALREAGVTVHCLGKKPSLYSPGTLYDLIRLTRREKPDVVHAQLFAANFYGRLAGMMSGVPVLISTEQNVIQGKRRLHIWADRALARRTDAIIAVSQAVRQAIAAELRYPSAPLEVIYNPVDLDTFRPDKRREEFRAALGLEPEQIALGAVGRLVKAKGHRYLLEALAVLLPEHPQARLLIIGGGALRGELEELGRELGVAGAVQFLGMRRDIPDLLNALDIFVFPSIWEGLPVALLEAMACRLPVVASDIAPVREVVGGRQAALLVPPADSRGLAGAIARLIAGRELARQLAAAGRERVLQEFSAQSCTRKLQDLYLQLLQAKGGATR